MRLQLFIGSTLVNAIFSFGMVALVLFSRPITKVKLFWVGMCISVGMWSLFFFGMVTTQSYKTALTFCQLLHISAIYIPVFLYYTVEALIKKNSKYLTMVFNTLSGLLVITTAMGYLLDVGPILEFKFFTQYKPLYWVFMLHLYGGFIVVEYNLWRAARTAPPLIKRQLYSLLWGSSLGFIGGQTTIPPVYGLEIFPYGIFFTPIYILAVGYSMLRYQFMDFHVALKKLGITIGIYGALLLLITPLAQPIIKSLLNYPPSLIYEVLALTALGTLILVMGPFIYILVLKKAYWLQGHSTVALTHELKSPLSNIRGAVEILDRKIPNQMDKDADLRVYVDILDRNTNRLENLIRNLLNIAAIQEGEINLTFKEFSIKKTAQAVIDQYLPLAKEKELGLLLHCNQDKIVLGDQEKVEQIFSNLLSNALKHTQHGNIEVTLNIKEREKEIVCSVQDQGEGIPAKDLSRVFNRFYQGSKSAKGTGIGLAIAKAWVQAHRGKIWAESEGVGKGATITFTLPI
ncbi:MAG: Adaptive-response sensory-kinase SasA [Elusimicrobia bacterium]|nr:Adaptive-response sensory-kinase SasA [Elusimicrobiota bacterium]